MASIQLVLLFSLFALGSSFSFLNSFDIPHALSVQDEIERQKDENTREQWDEFWREFAAVSKNVTTLIQRDQEVTVQWPSSLHCLRTGIGRRDVINFLESLGYTTGTRFRAKAPLRSEDGAVASYQPSSEILVFHIDKSRWLF
jgi:hypothetical protein